jgi:hypothetical protein
MHRPRHAPLVLALALGVCAPPAVAQPAPAAAAEETVGRDAREMDALLGRLTDGDPAARRVPPPTRSCGAWRSTTSPPSGSASWPRPASTSSSSG